MTDSKLILQAISLRHCLEVTYNRMRMKLAPHILYTRHGDLFVDAVVVEREGRTFSEAKLGTFKVAGLQLAELITRPFQPLPGFDAASPKYLESTPFAVSAS